MKIKYTFADGTTSEIEVSKEVHEATVELDKQEAASDRRYRRHTYSLDAVGFEGMEYGTEDTAETDLITCEENTRIAEAMSHLTETQRRRLRMLADGLSMREIARIEGVNIRAASESIALARKKFKKIF